MYFATLLSVLACASSVLAITVTSPAQGALWDETKDNTITWTAESGAESSFGIELVNMAVNPSITVALANNVQTSAGSYVMQPQSVPAGQAYQINLVATNGGILAQSNQFNITKSATSSSSSSESSSSSSSTTSSTSIASPAGASIPLASTTTTGSTSGSTTLATVTSTGTMSGSTTTGTSTMTSVVAPTGSESSTSSSASSSSSASVNAAAGLNKEVTGFGAMLMGLAVVLA